jgi:peptide/nickel transport system substrate-binding protein
MTEWTHNQILKHRRKPDYFMQPFPYADEFHMVTIPDVQTAQAAFRTGQVMNNLTNEQITDLLKQSVADLQIADEKLLGAASGDRLWMNPTRAPVSDVRVRQGLGLLYDRQNVIKNVLFGDGWITSGVFMPVEDWHLTFEQMSEWLAYDPQKARQLFDAAGFDTGSWKPMLDAGIPGGTNGTVPGAEAYVASLRGVGIEATINIVDKTEIVDQVWRQARTEFCVCNKPTFSGTNGELYVFYHSTGNLAEPYRLLADEELDRLIDQQAAELDTERRQEILADLQRRIVETAVASPLFSRLGTTAVQPYVRNYKHDTEDVHRFSGVWLDT